LTEPLPGVERPAWRVLLARLAIDLSPLREFPDFRRLWIGQSISFLGGELTFVAMPFQLYQLTHSTLALGLFSLTQLVPLLTLTLVGGAIADAFDRRKLLLGTEAAEALAVGGLAVNAVLPHPNVPVLFVLATIAASCFSLGVGGMRSLTPRLVTDETLTAASALNSVYSAFGSVLGPALAGLLIKFVGLTGAYAIDALSFVASLIALWGLPRIPPLHDADSPSLRSILDGFRFVRRQKVILGFFLVDTNAMIFGMPMALFPAVADHRFGDPTLVGYLYSAPAAGAFLATITAGWVPHIRRQGVAVVVAATAWGAAIVGFGFATSLWLALLMLAVAGGADQISAIFRSTMMMRLTPDHLRGRLAGIEFAQVASAPSLGNLEAGVVASLTSLRFSIVSGGLLCIVGTLAAALAFPALLRYDSRDREPAHA
jgi:MFS family permease